MNTTQQTAPATQPTAHTPGPWAWQIEDHSMATLYGQDGLSDQVMAVAPCDSCLKNLKQLGDKEWQWGRCRVPSEADARLIAAAPTMLEALNKAVDAAEYSIRLLEANVKAGGSPSPFEKADWQGACAQVYAAMAFVGEARAAIAEAEGRP